MPWRVGAACILDVDAMLACIIDVDAMLACIIDVDDMLACIIDVDAMLACFSFNFIVLCTLPTCETLCWRVEFVLLSLGFLLWQSGETGGDNQMK